jgi:hypothetical protein
MEIHLGLLPYPKENDTSEEVSLYFTICYHFNTVLLIKVGKKNLSSYIALLFNSTRKWQLLKKDTHKWVIFQKMKTV